ncbi:hypothetical protein V496_10272 [Pseudogymnoascus sp. VKM F-4515 (FW-2607)]|nr:hypothetical protein V496_10272 [Pseudogymnoascus sp. VKM F-4515 (FW-2607)]
MLILAAVGIVPGIILATFAVAGVCFPTTSLGELTRAPFSQGSPEAAANSRANDAQIRTANELERQNNDQAERSLVGQSQ